MTLKDNGIYNVEDHFLVSNLKFWQSNQGNKWATNTSRAKTACLQLPIWKSSKIILKLIINNQLLG